MAIRYRTIYCMAYSHSLKLMQHSVHEKIINHYWDPYAPIQTKILSLLNPESLIVEIGPGHIPFELATEFIDWQLSPRLKGKKVHAMDINTKPLPYDDKSVDFIYCRHVLEDIYNPAWVCQEMSRVAKAGYIETPSPISECCRGVDGGSPFWRGYIHHRYLVWVDERDKLTFLPKYPVIEYLDFGAEDEYIIELLNQGALHWNTYYLWENEINFQYLQHDSEFKVQENYLEVIKEALSISAINAINVSIVTG